MNIEDHSSALDPDMTDEQKAFIALLGDGFVQEVDAALMASASTAWRKISRVVGEAMLTQESRPPGVPDLYYAQRVRVLIADGELDVSGDPMRMRYCEVRIRMPNGAA